MSRLPVIAAMAGTAAALCIGYLMIPGPLEQVTMLMRDRRYDAAVDQVNSLLDSGNQEPGLLMQAFLLNERHGDPDRAAKAFHAYFKLRPDDADAWRKAAKAYTDSGQVAPLVLALENLVRLTSEGEARSQLAGLYRMQSLIEDEIRVLKGADPKSLVPEDAIRLASLLVGKREIPQAISILVALDDRKELLSDGGRILFFNALLEHRDFEEASARAIGWLQAGDGRRIQDILMAYLLRAGADEPALRLATHDKSIDDPATITQLSELVAREGRLDLLERLVARWLGHAAELPVERIDSHLQQVVDIARQKGVSSELFRQFALALQRRNAPLLEASFAQAIFNQYGYAAIAPFRTALKPEILAFRPVFAARLLMLERNELAARHYLLRADLSALSIRDNFDWLSAAGNMLTPHEMVNELAIRARSGTIPAEMTRPVLQIAAQMGTQPQLQDLWSTLMGGKNGARRAR